MERLGARSRDHRMNCALTRLSSAPGLDADRVLQRRDKDRTSAVVPRWAALLMTAPDRIVHHAIRHPRPRLWSAGVKSTVYSCPRYVSVWRIESIRTPAHLAYRQGHHSQISPSASLASWSLKGCTIASTFTSLKTNQPLVELVRTHSSSVKKRSFLRISHPNAVRGPRET